MSSRSNPSLDLNIYAANMHVDLSKAVKDLHSVAQESENDTLKDMTCQTYSLTRVAVWFLRPLAGQDQSNKGLPGLFLTPWSVRKQK